MPSLDAARQRAFALEVVKTLREAGFETYWAGGCVRDQLLDITPKDYDVATMATPEEVRTLFGKKRTLAIGQSFGVITILGPKCAGMIEVATFRSDGEYSDGRRPDSVHFCSAEEDAKRRDFTINGLFYCPVEERVIDFVGGREDMERKVVRAIGDPDARFGEDKLRMLRAVRFAATFGFVIDKETLTTIRRRHEEVTVVSAERIATELRRMLSHETRRAAVSLLRDSRLGGAVMPEVFAESKACSAEFENALKMLGYLHDASFSLALATLLYGFVDESAVELLGRRLKLSNDEIARVSWLLSYAESLDDAPRQPWSGIQPILIHPGIEDLLELGRVRMQLEGRSAEALAFCREKLLLPPDVLNPPPLIDGQDLIAEGIAPGPIFAVLLQRTRDAQLDGEIRTREEAMAAVSRWRCGQGDS